MFIFVDLLGFTVEFYRVQICKLLAVSMGQEKNQNSVFYNLLLFISPTRPKYFSTTKRSSIQMVRNPKGYGSWYPKSIGD